MLATVLVVMVYLELLALAAELHQVFAKVIVGAVAAYQDFGSDLAQAYAVGDPYYLALELIAASA